MTAPAALAVGPRSPSRGEDPDWDALCRWLEHAGRRAPRDSLWELLSSLLACRVCGETVLLALALGWLEGWSQESRAQAWVHSPRGTSCGTENEEN